MLLGTVLVMRLLKDEWYVRFNFTFFVLLYIACTPSIHIDSYDELNGRPIRNCHHMLVMRLKCMELLASPPV